MASQDTLYLEGCANQNNDKELCVSIETYITLFVLSSCDNHNFQVCFVDTGLSSYPCSLKNISTNDCNCRFIKQTSDDIEGVSCSLPAIKSTDQNTYLGGLCAVLRWTVKSLTQSSSDHPCRSLLGFRGNCLVACSESSVWTKFCELEMPQAVKEVAAMLKNSHQECLTIPKNLMKLEVHLTKPVKTHNILKRKQDIAKDVKINSSIQQTDSSSQSKEKLQAKQQTDCISPDIDFIVRNSVDSTVTSRTNSIAKIFENLKITEANDDFHLEHCYVEGIDLTLADMILLPCVHYLLHNLNSSSSIYLPHVIRWYNKMFANALVQAGADVCGWTKWDVDTSLPLGEKLVTIVVPYVEPVSLYSRDPSRPKLRCRNFDPSPVLSHLEKHGVHPQYDHEFYDNFVGLRWNDLPPDLHPSSGDLPKNRVERKCQQLESIVWAVLKVARPGQTIVDFCAGGGHVGLLLAYHLKDCKVILVENKEASMFRAKNRAQALGLKNVSFFQCNLDYFRGSFDVGVSLHACGVATDLVIQQCLQNKAGFICCPCCYGSIQETHLLKYPLSTKFQAISVSYEDFRYLAHCADRTEVNTPKAKEGKLCMGLIDTDRKMYAKEFNYKIWLSTLQPESCSPKHNILVGVPQIWCNT